MKTTCLILLLLGSFLSYGQSEDSLFRKASALYKDDRLQSALKEINNLIRQSPARAEYYELRGSIHFDLQERSKAIEDMTKAIALDPSKALYYHRRAVFYYSIMEPDYAIEDNNMAIQLLEGNDSLRYGEILNRGNAYVMKRDFNNAYKDYLTVLNYDSTRLDVLTNIGACLDDLGRGEDAIRYLERAIQYHPDFVGGYINLGFKYSNAGNYTKALEYMNKALEIDPEDPLAYNNRGYVLYKLGDLNGAMKDINTSIKAYPSNSYAFRNRALVNLAMKKNKEACNDLKKSIELGFTEMYGEEVKQLLEKNCK